MYDTSVPPEALSDALEDTVSLIGLIGSWSPCMSPQLSLEVPRYHETLVYFGTPRDNASSIYGIQEQKSLYRR